jgi:hypothetical protein
MEKRTNWIPIMKEFVFDWQASTMTRRNTNCRGIMLNGWSSGHPPRGVIFSLLGVAQMTMGHWDQAEESLEQVVQPNPNLAGAYNKLGKPGDERAPAGKSRKGIPTRAGDKIPKARPTRRTCKAAERAVARQN